MKKIISCKIYEPYYKLLEERHNLSYDITWIEVKKHNNPNLLGKEIQDEIDRSTGYELIIILYGICGNALINIRSKGIPLLLLKVHDCSSVLLGSKDRHMKIFGKTLSRRWGSESYSLEESSEYSRKSPEYLKLVEEFGIENADYAYEVMYSSSAEKPIYITFNSSKDKDFIAKHASEIEVITGDLSMIEDVLLGDYSSLDIAIMMDKEVIEPLYDMKEVFVIKKP